MSSIAGINTTIIPVRLEDVPQRQHLLEQAARSTDHRLYLALQGPAASQPPTLATLDALVHCFEAAAVVKPRLDVVPLFPSLGWTPETVSEINIDRIIASSSEDTTTQLAFSEEINQFRESRSLPKVEIATIKSSKAQPSSLSTSTATNEGSPPKCESRVIGDWNGPLVFNTVAVGGTFDRLHAGHRLLLAATALVARKHIFVGITADKLLANKKNAELLETYDTRAAAAVDYMQSINPSLTVTDGPLTDPLIPPLCATERDFDAIVVSEETIHGAEAINSVRADLGFHPLVIVVVGLIASQQKSVKLSSTDLRVLEAGVAKKKLAS